MNNFTFGNARHQYYETICGGAGRGPEFDGASAVHTHMTNSRLTDPEILEWRYPVRVRRFEIRAGSRRPRRAARRRRRVREIEFLEPMHAAILSNRRRVPPFGLAGGGAGACGKNYVIRADGAVERLAATASVEFARGRPVRDRDAGRRRLRRASASSNSRGGSPRPATSTTSVVMLRS